jgi:uncharacterized protein (DUF1800 family)
LKHLSRMIANQNDKHLRLRAAFGLSPQKKSPYNNVLAWINSSTRNSPIEVIEKTEMPSDAKDTPKQNAKLALVKSREQVLKLNETWMTQLTDSAVVAREKMTLFWHDHFACRARSAYLAQQQNNVLRQHALGKFGDLLHAVSKDPAMLQFLNNQQNKKNSPNENFARELLELFTLGRGHYSEEDIKNSARAFTGWSFNPVSGKFFFREKVHDEGVKVFRGKQGKLKGEDILRIILEDKQTAYFVTDKIWRYLVCHEETDNDLLHELARGFYESGYDIEKLLLKIFSSTWFYEPRFTGNRIKSPIEFVAGIITQTGGKFEHSQAVLFIQRALSQILFFPPNVGGWPAGTGWIDSSSLTFRMSLPSLLLKNSAPTIEAKDDGDVNNATNYSTAKKLTFYVDWENLANQFTKTTAAESLAALEYYLLARPATEAGKKIVHKSAADSHVDTEFIKNACIGFMSLPEYQLS